MVVTVPKDVPVALTSIVGVSLIVATTMNSTMVQLLQQPIHIAHPWGTHWLWSMTLQCNMRQPHLTDSRLKMEYLNGENN